MAFTVAISVELKNESLRKENYTKFQLDRSINAESARRNAFTILNKI